MRRTLNKVRVLNEVYIFPEAPRPIKPYPGMHIFSDGATVDASGDYRPMRLHLGWCIIGKGKVIKCTDESECYKKISQLSA